MSSSVIRRAVLLALPVLLAACSGGGGDAQDGDGAAPALRVALLTSGPVTDAGWYAGAYEGLLEIESRLGAQVSHQQTRTPAEFDEAFLAYAAEGYDLIFAHGSEYQDAAIRAGEQFPDTKIIVSGGGRVSDAVQPLIFQLEQATYVAGMAAGGMTKSNLIGMVGGVEIPPARGAFMAFEAGVHAVNPDAEVLEVWIGNWDDVAAAKEAAVAQLRRGADVIVHNTDGASFGVFQAVREAVDAGTPAWAIGMNRDQNDVAPEVILGSAAIMIPEAFLDVATRFRDGTLPPGPIYGGAETEVVRFVPNPAVLDRYPAQLLEQIEAARAAIRDGSLEVPCVPFVEGDGETPDGGDAGV